MNISKIPLSEALVEVSSGVGPNWADYRVLGATRAGLALAKEPVGKAPTRYKLVEPGTIFYNPMRIMIGSIAMVDDGEESGITSPDYVVFRARPGVLHHRWFYYWLRSKYGEDLIRSLARGAVRERLLFKRLVRGAIAAPSWNCQVSIAAKLKLSGSLANATNEAHATARDLNLSYLREVFESADAAQWPRVALLDLLAEPLRTGISKPPSPNADKLCLTLGAVANGALDCAAVKSSDVTDAQAEGNWIKPGAFYVVRGNGNRHLVGRGAICPEGAPRVLYPDLLIQVVVDRAKILPEFLSAAWNTPFVRKDIESRCRTTNGIHKINQANLGMVRVPCPLDIRTQQGVVESLGLKFKRTAELAGQLGDVRLAAKALQDRLLVPISSENLNDPRE